MSNSDQTPPLNSPNARLAELLGRDYPGEPPNWYGDIAALWQLLEELGGDDDFPVSVWNAISGKTTARYLFLHSREDAATLIAEALQRPKVKPWSESVNSDQWLEGEREKDHPLQEVGTYRDEYPPWIDQEFLNGMADLLEQRNREPSWQFERIV